MAITRQQKEEILKELADMFKNSKSVAFGQYAGMSVDEMQTMRSEMRDAGVTFKVAKRTLFKLAAKDAGLELPDEILEGTVGAAFSNEDVISGPKILKTTSKKVKVVKLMGGIMEGKILSIDDMRELADIPSRDALLAKFVGMMQGPLQSFYGILSAPTSSLARAFSEYAKLIPAEEAAVAETPKEIPAEEAPAEEAVAETAEAPAEESEGESTES